MTSLGLLLSASSKPLVPREGTRGPRETFVARAPRDLLVELGGAARFVAAASCCRQASSRCPYQGSLSSLCREQPPSRASFHFAGAVVTLVVSVQNAIRCAVLSCVSVSSRRAPLISAKRLSRRRRPLGIRWALVRWHDSRRVVIARTSATRAEAPGNLGPRMVKTGMWAASPDGVALSSGVLWAFVG